jgi:hypothetical protein
MIEKATDRELMDEWSNSGEPDEETFQADLFLNFTAILIVSIGIGLLGHVLEAREMANAPGHADFEICRDEIRHSASGERVDAARFIGSEFESHLQHFVQGKSTLKVDFSKDAESAAFYFFSSLSRVGFYEVEARVSPCR